MNENRYPAPLPGHGPHDRYGGYGDQHLHQDAPGGHAAYGASGHWYGPPAPLGDHGVFYPPAPHPPSQDTSGAVVALVVSIMLVMTCCGAPAVVGIVYSALALSEKTDPEKYRSHTRNAWISNGVFLGLLAVLLLLFVLLLVSGV